MDKFVQMFSRGSKYKKRTLVKEFKREINSNIRYKLMEIKQPSLDIEEWFDRLINLDRNWKKSREEEEKMRKREESLALRLNILANARGA